MGGSNVTKCPFRRAVMDNGTSSSKHNLIVRSLSAGSTLDN